MSAGTYIFTGSLGLQGHGSLDGSAGVTIYLAAPNGNMNMGGSGNSNLSLSAPSTGPFANVAIYQEPADTNPVNMEGTPVSGAHRDYLPAFSNARAWRQQHYPEPHH